VQRIRQATETIAGLTHRIAALRDIVTVDYPAGNRTAVPMVNFKASSDGNGGTTDGAGKGGAAATPAGAEERTSGTGGKNGPEDQTPNVG
jgi:hypothetical protein